MRELTTPELQSIYERFSGLIAEGKGDDARDYLNDEFLRLPKDLQDELTAYMIVDALEGEVTRRETVAQIQEEGIAAAEIFKKARSEATE